MSDVIVALPTNPLAEQLVALSAQVVEMSTQRTTYVAGTVTALDNVNVTFAADITQPDATTINVAGIRTSAQFMPSIGTVATLALSGPQIIYQPFGVAGGSIDTPQLSTTVTGTITGAVTTANGAVTTANGAVTTANGAVTTANSASSTATTALTTANGKNKVTYSLSAASGSGTATGDLWFQVDGSGLVIVSSVWTGSAWVAHNFGDAVLNSLTAGKLTAGTMSADVVISGRFATALSGARVELNSAGLQKWDSGGSQLVSITGSTNLLTGTFKTALTGRRIEIGVGGTTGQINFTDGSGGALGNVIAQTATNGTEVIEMVAPITSTDPAYNGVSVQGNERIYTISNQVVSQYAGTTAFFEVDSLSSKATGWTSNARYKIDETGGHMWWTGSAVSRMSINTSGFGLASNSAITFFDQLVASPNNRIRLMPNGPSLGTIEILDRNSVSQQSARIALIQDTGGAVQIKCFLNELQVRNSTDAAFAPIDASVFNVSSDADGKTNITDATLDAVGRIRGLRPRNYQRKDANGQASGPVELGLVASEAPPEIVVPLASSDGPGQGINLYSYITLIATGLKQGFVALDALTTRVAALEAKVH